MVEALATIIILFLMLVPVVNIIVGAIAWGFLGFIVGLILTFVGMAILGNAVNR